MAPRRLRLFQESGGTPAANTRPRCSAPAFVITLLAVGALCMRPAAAVDLDASQGTPHPIARHTFHYPFPATSLPGAGPLHYFCSPCCGICLPCLPRYTRICRGSHFPRKGGPPVLNRAAELSVAVPLRLQCPF